MNCQLGLAPLWETYVPNSTETSKRRLFVSVSVGASQNPTNTPCFHVVSFSTLHLKYLNCHTVVMLQYRKSF